MVGPERERSYRKKGEILKNYINVLIINKERKRPDIAQGKFIYNNTITKVLYRF